MTRGKISVGKRWIARLLPGWSGPEAVDDVVAMTTPWEGTGRYTDLVWYGNSATAADITKSPVVPDDRQWWVPYCEMFHTDVALTAHAFIEIRNRAIQDVTVVGGADVTAHRHISIRRPLIIPEGGRIVANLSTVTVDPGYIALRVFYVETPLGEFVPPI